MKKKRIYIALIYLLGTSLLFNQVGLSFFHNKHDSHESCTTKNDRAQVHQPGENCKVCALDTLFHLFFETASEFHFYLTGEVVYSTPDPAKVVSSTAFIKGRAPPFSV